VSSDTIYCADTNLHIFGNDFEADVIGFFSDYVVTLAAVSFKTLFFLPLPMPP